MAAIFYISTSNVWELQIFYINANIYFAFNMNLHDIMFKRLKY